MQTTTETNPTASTALPEPEALPKRRLLSLDVFRGMTIAGMIMVNNPGSWEFVYAPLRHARWHGATPTDWVFPFFLFIVGVAIPLALGRRKARGDDRKAIIGKILRRSLLIFLIGVFLNGFPYFDFSTIRIPGVLQRIALVYLAASLLFLYLSPRALVWTTVGLLLGYWAIMTLVPVPGGVAPNLEPETNLGAWLDRLLLGGHLWGQSVTWDPEGLLSTVPAVASGLIGVLASLWLREPRGDYEKIAPMLAVGAVLLAIGYMWHPLFPINKALWTSSFVCYTGGLALLFLGVIYWLADIRGSRWWTKPFVIYGMNALFVFIMSGLLPRLLNLIRIPSGDGESVGLLNAFYQSVLVPIFDSPLNASLAYALLNVLFFWLLAWVLYRRGIFIRV